MFPAYSTTLREARELKEMPVSDQEPAREAANLPTRTFLVERSITQLKSPILLWNHWTDRPLSRVVSVIASSQPIIRWARR